VTFVLYFGLFGLSYLLVAGGQAALGWSATSAATSVVPMAVAMWLGAERLGPVAQRVGTRPVLAGAVIAAAVGLAWTAYGVRDGATWWHLLPGTVVFGIALAAAAAPLTHAAVTSLPAALAGVGSAVHHAVVRAAGMCATLGLATLATGSQVPNHAEGIAWALLAAAGVVAVGGLACVWLFDGPGTGTVSAADRRRADAVTPRADHGAVGHQARTS
jgi:hypothetical protein